MGLMARLLEKFAWVSYEPVLSGVGLYEIYALIRDRAIMRSCRGSRTSSSRMRLPPASFGTLDRLSPPCLQAGDLFVSFWPGAEAGT